MSYSKENGFMPKKRSEYMSLLKEKTEEILGYHASTAEEFEGSNIYFIFSNFIEQIQNADNNVVYFMDDFFNFMKEKNLTIEMANSASYLGVQKNFESISNGFSYLTRFSHKQDPFYQYSLKAGQALLAIDHITTDTKKQMKAFQSLPLGCEILENKGYGDDKEIEENDLKKTLSITTSNGNTFIYPYLSCQELLWTYHISYRSLYSLPINIEDKLKETFISEFEKHVKIGSIWEPMIYLQGIDSLAEVEIKVDKQDGKGPVKGMQHVKYFQKPIINNEHCIIFHKRDSLDPIYPNGETK